MIKVHVLVHLRPDILDVQGQAIHNALRVAGHGAIKAVTQGKSFHLSVDAPSVDAAREEIERVCRETLSNPLLEDYTWKVIEQ